MGKSLNSVVVNVMKSDLYYNVMKSDLYYQFDLTKRELVFIYSIPVSLLA